MSPSLSPVDNMATESSPEQHPDHQMGNGHDSRMNQEGDNSSVPKPKRLACMICRKRKLKCDGIKPSCSTCTRLGHSCAYDEVRRKSGPKRGYVKALEERLKHVETLLNQQDSAPAPDAAKNAGLAGMNGKAAAAAAARAKAGTFGLPGDPAMGMGRGNDIDRWHMNGDSPPQPGSLEDFNFNSTMNLNMNGVDSNFTWEIINLGLDEPLPPQETIDELHQIYFEKIHPSNPMIHKYRYLAAMNLAPNQRPPVCLRYAMWTQACSVTEKYNDLKDLFYQRARKYVESDYIKGYGEQIISVAHCQTHVLLASYEFKMMYFPRGWMSTGQAVRLAQALGLHRMDGTGLDVKQCLAPPRDWTEKEERRRTFWMAYCEDRYASIGTGWPMTVEEKDISSHLPSTEEAFDMSRSETTCTLQEAMSPAGAAKLSSFAGIVLMASLFGRNLTHLHRPDSDDRDHDLNGEFWKRHRGLDNILLNTSLCLPGHLKLPAGLGNPNNVFTNMCIHTSTICLHQAAIFKAEQHRLPASVSAESKIRCITAANEIASIMRMVSHMDLSSMNPFISFCLYVSARVFVQFLKSRPDDTQTSDALRFMLHAMNALKRQNPLTESFLVQLDVDLEALGAKVPKLRAMFPRSGDSPIPAPQPVGGRSGAPCEEGPGSVGIMQYKNECLFTKVMGDDGNIANAPDLVEAEPDAGAQQARPSNGWLNEQRLPSRERSTGGHSPIYPMQGVAYSTSAGYNPVLSTSGLPLNAGTYGHASDSGDTGGDMSTSPNGPSNQPTPGSSTASDHRQNLAPGVGAMGASSRSGRDSFDASPVSSHQTLSSAAAELERTIAGGIDPASNSIFGDPHFGLGMAVGPPVGSAPPVVNGGTGLTPGADFTGWDQTMPDGLLRNIMQLGPMETMDLGWDPRHQ